MILFIRLQKSHLFSQINLWKRFNEVRAKPAVNIQY
jgi:hypothetical protein